MAFVVTINVTTREVSDQNPSDVRRISVVESKGEGKSTELAFHSAYEASGLKEFVDALSGMPKILTPGNFGQGS